MKVIPRPQPTKLSAEDRLGTSTTRGGAKE